MSALTSSNPDNANPTVHKTGNESSSRSRYRLGDFLDDNNDQDQDDEDIIFYGEEGEGGSSSNALLNRDTIMHEDDDGLTYEGQTESEHSSSDSEEGEPIDSQEIFGGSITS